MKAAERGEPIVFDPTGKIAASREKGLVTFAVVMDDKILKIEMSWATINEMNEAGISEWILRHMRESRESVH